MRTERRSNAAVVYRVRTLRVIGQLHGSAGKRRHSTLALILLVNGSRGPSGESDGQTRVRTWNWFSRSAGERCVALQLQRQLLRRLTIMGMRMP